MVVSLNNLDLVIKKLKHIIDNRDIVVLLRGDLASGKTTLVKNYVKSLGLEDRVTSPTFSLQTLYGKDIFHYDVYNKTLDEFIALGLLEEFEKEGIHFVEWGDEKLEAILKDYGFNVLTVKIKKLEKKREYIIES
ncbi:MAG: tRNA (adenosine(37)-N6)-threonylcarbamoyltransferase complex ATPase subunit type 1 TsaE [Arcobacteraceae bacterium]|nr:tRNA (adenosine(37)-N6)-threonylcarbamoyltransferase complex ATPase subunit type 1 TsaE [Arcobacteraceae bacterium]